ncbi:MAG: NAD-dependent epimerase/dehydratase family protein [Ruminococcaceae bacterium]|nr:NAD-dependent epimerase/dehydratase family protein [Oscillospiraceae bacterium]
MSIEHILVLGAAGFSGMHLCRELEQCGYRVTKADTLPRADCISSDLLDRAALDLLIVRYKPDAIINLAGFPSVGRSWQQPREAIDINLCAAVNLLEAVRHSGMPVRLLLIGSSEQYGDADGLVGEDTAQCPASPYAISKQAQEQLALLYHRVYGMDIVLTRTFNSIGPGQRKGFVMADLASGIVRIERGLQDKLPIGNTAAVRCFTDMRDTVRAYRLLVEKGVSGRVYNVGSDKPYSVQQLLDMLISLSGREIQTERDAARFRAADPRCVRCDHTLLTADTGWQCQYTTEQTLKDILQHFRALPDSEI